MVLIESTAGLPPLCKLSSHVSPDLLTEKERKREQETIELSSELLLT